MPEIKEITVYRFEELEGKAKDKARQWLVEAATDHDWYESVYDLAKEDGAKRGFEIEDIRFSGFWSQGDGASWTGTVSVWRFIEWALDQGENSPQFRRIGDDRHRYLCFVELMKDGWIEPHVNIVRTSYHYVHENTVRPENGIEWAHLESEMGLDSDVQHESTLRSEGVLKGASVVGVAEGIDIKSLVPEVDELITEEVRDFCQEIYKMLEKEYDALTEDESLQELADSNDWRFDAAGNFV